MMKIAGSESGSRSISQRHGSATLVFCTNFPYLSSDGTVDNEVRLEDFSDLQELGVVEVVGDDR
jgi:hypothetical protein